MKFVKEAKVGLLGIITLTILYFGFSFLKGLDVFSTENEYIGYFNDVEGLQASNPVVFNGVTVGRVMVIEPEQEKNRVKIVMAIKRTIKLTENTIASLADDGLLGGKKIKLLIQAGKELEDDAEVKTGFEKGLLNSTTEKLDPLFHHVDSLAVTLTAIVKQFDQTGVALKALMANANKTTAGVNGVIASNSKSLSAITGNAAVLTANLNTLTNSLDSQIKPILSKTNTFADSLNAVKLGQTVQNLNTSVASLQHILKDINQGKGTLGKITSDDSLYVNLDRTAANLSLLLSDMKQNPKRYVHFSLFARKEKKK